METGGIDPVTIGLLAIAGFVASFIDSQVGGGGVITLPSLLLAGLPPHVALATNKLGGTASAFVASANYIHKGAVPLDRALKLAPLAFVGGLLGVLLVLRVSGDFLLPVILALMGGMTLYVLLRPSFGRDDRPAAEAWRLPVMALCAFAIGTYDGVLGPGTGSFLLVALVGLLGYGFRRAAALGRVLNLASNVAALSLFAALGYVDWVVGLPMAVTMAAGGWLGSHTTIRHGDRVIKPLFVGVTLLLMARLAMRIL